MPRVAAALIALIAWFGLAIQFSATFAAQESLGATLWILARFFTVLTNLIVAFTFTALALGRQVSPSLLGGVTLAIALVGAVYVLLLRGLLELSGGALLADTLLHKVVPVLAPLWWLVFAPKGGLRQRDPWLWALYPLTYFAYAIARGLSGDKYPYPFMNVDEIGWPQTLINSALIALCFVVAGYAMTWLDRRLARRG
jgi:hypothetical protein